MNDLAPDGTSSNGYSPRLGDFPAIEAAGLSKKYGNFEAVKSLSLRVSQGEILGFLGPNGAGKTTTIKMLTGLLKPTSGSGTVAGFDVATHAEDIKQHIGY